MPLSLTSQSSLRPPDWAQSGSRAASDGRGEGDVLVRRVEMDIAGDTILVPRCLRSNAAASRTAVYLQGRKHLDRPPDRYRIGALLGFLSMIRRRWLRDDVGDRGRLWTSVGA